MKHEILTKHITHLGFKQFYGQEVVNESMVTSKTLQKHGDWPFYGLTALVSNKTTLI